MSCGVKMKWKVFSKISVTKLWYKKNDPEQKFQFVISIVVAKFAAWTKSEFITLIQ